jgi:hypothetical protein
VELSRRTLVKAGGLTAALSAVPSGRAIAQAREPQTVTLTGVAFGTGQYQYLPFTVPPGVNRLDVAIVKQGSAATGIGLFDQRGAQYATLERPNGFRGLYGEERGEFFVATDSASDAFIPGPVEPGQWTVLVAVFNARQPTPYTVTVQMSAVPAGPAFVLGRDLEVVLPEAGWYRGDLHAHTPQSSDAFKSGSALTPRQWADECRRIGLDFLALTDHNVVTQNFAIADSAGQDVLLMAGEEMTNFFYGHATVSGITPGEWFDWRQLPAGELTARPDPNSGTIQQFIEAATASGAYVSVAHPLGATLAWRFFPEAAVDPAARTQGLEVWTGPFQPDDEASLRAWDSMLLQGQRIVANGGSDLHGTQNDQGFASGTPTTVVHAEALSKRAVVAALKAGRSFVTRLPDGVELYLTATGVDGQRQIMGGTVYGAPTDVVEFEVLVRRAGGMRLIVVRDGAPVSVVPLTERRAGRALLHTRGRRRLRPRRGAWRALRLAHGSALEPHRHGGLQQPGLPAAGARPRRHDTGLHPTAGAGRAPPGSRATTGRTTCRTAVDPARGGWPGRARPCAAGHRRARPAAGRRGGARRSRSAGPADDAHRGADPCRLRRHAGRGAGAARRPGDGGAPRPGRPDPLGPGLLLERRAGRRSRSCSTSPPPCPAPGGRSRAAGSRAPEPATTRPGCGRPGRSP